MESLKETFRSLKAKAYDLIAQKEWAIRELEETNKEIASVAEKMVKQNEVQGNNKSKK